MHVMYERPDIHGYFSWSFNSYIYFDCSPWWVGISFRTSIMRKLHVTSSDKLFSWMVREWKEGSNRFEKVGRNTIEQNYFRSTICMSALQLWEYRLRKASHVTCIYIYIYIGILVLCARDSRHLHPKWDDLFASDMYASSFHSRTCQLYIAAGWRERVIGNQTFRQIQPNDRAQLADFRGNVSLSRALRMLRAAIGRAVACNCR